MNRKLLFLVPFLAVALFYACSRPDSSGTSQELNVMAYYFPSHGAYDPEKLPLDRLTHIIFSFTEVIGYEMKFPDDSSGIKLRMLVKLKKKHPHLKVMVACGGWGGSGGFSEMARSVENRKKFVESAVRFIREYELDGIDIDWEYPGMRGIGNPYIPEDRENFTSLLQDLREGMDRIGKEQILTFAAAGWERFFDHVELDKVMQYANYMNIMSYDLAGGDDPYTAHHTNLGLVRIEDIEGTPAAIKIREEGDSTKPWSAEKIISFCMQKGVGPGQIVIGAAFFGKGWIGVPSENNGLYQLNRGPWRGYGRYSSLREKFENRNGYIRYWDPVAKAPYLYNAMDSVFISYEDTVSIRLKTEYALQMGLGGIMFWQLGGDASRDGLVDAINAAKKKYNKNRYQNEN